MNRTLSTLAVAAILLGSGLAGCGGTNGEDSPSSAEITAAARGAARELDPEARMDDDDERDRAVDRFMSLLNELRQVPALAPLFELYQVPDPIVIEDDDRSAELLQLLRAVRFTQSAGMVTIWNRETGEVIYSAPLRDLEDGVFHPENMPGSTTPPPPDPETCTSFSYSPWGACRSDGTQARTVLSASPSGCTGGSPVLTQACTYVPPAPATCTSFNYSPWNACQPDGTQTRTVTGSSPAGCTGGSPVTSQRCTYVPPVTTCTSFNYSPWNACQPDGTQTRTVTGSSPAGCTGGSPVTSQRCTYTPPACTYTYSPWSACSASGTQTRTVASSSPAGCAGTPVLTQSCTPPTQSCNTCHGIPPSTGRHSRHTFASCATCHGTGYSTTTANPATHQNGVTNVVSSVGWDASANSCANSCHGSRGW